MGERRRTDFLNGCYVSLESWCFCFRKNLLWCLLFLWIFCKTVRDPDKSQVCSLQLVNKKVWRLTQAARTPAQSGVSCLSWLLAGTHNSVHLQPFLIKSPEINRRFSHQIILWMRFVDLRIILISIDVKMISLINNVSLIKDESHASLRRRMDRREGPDHQRISFPPVI